MRTCLHRAPARPTSAPMARRDPGAARRWRVHVRCRADPRWSPPGRLRDVSSGVRRSGCVRVGGGATMATYVSLVRYTDQGIRSIKQSPERLDAAKKAFQAGGGELKQFFLL